MKVDQTSFSGVTFHDESNGHTQRVIPYTRATSTISFMHWPCSGVDDTAVSREMRINLFFHLKRIKRNLLWHRNGKERQQTKKQMKQMTQK